MAQKYKKEKTPDSRFFFDIEQRQKAQENLQFAVVKFTLRLYL